jgi:aminoglycoside phosphotransferase (APT) family kinase protein
MTEEPWRGFGPELTSREQAAQRELGSSPVPAPRTLGLDAEGVATGVSAHLMSRVAGEPTTTVGAGELKAMSEMLATIHDVRPPEPFRTFQSWAWEGKWVVPAWTEHPGSWQRAFDLLATDAPSYEPTFLHRDYSHRNLLWEDGRISGVVDWVETSTGPAWLDAGHAASNLAVLVGREPALAFLDAYAATTGCNPDTYWLVMDVVGFLPPPGREPLFKAPADLVRLDAWLHELMTDRVR